MEFIPITDNSNNHKRTTVALRTETLLRLKNFGKFHESYEDVVSRLLDEVIQNREAMTSEINPRGVID